MIYPIIFIIASLAGTSHGSTYMIAVPEYIRPGMDLTVDVHLLMDHTTTTIKAQVVNWRNEVIVQSNLTFSKDVFHGLVSMELPDNLVFDSYRLGISAQGGMVFMTTTYLKYNPKSSSVLVQTDKSIYKPGQTVQFRAFSIKPDLSVVYSPMDVEIHDPKGNKIMQLRGVSDPSGVYQGSMAMSTEPVLGDWRIVVSQNFEAAVKIFTVDEYVLPTFEVTIDLPSFGLTSDEILPIVVKGMYTFGKRVKGTVLITIKQNRYYWYLGNPAITHEGSIDGEYKYIASMVCLREMFRYINYQTFEVSAVVTEYLTGEIATAKAEITFYDSSYKIQFEESMPKHFKPGLIYNGIIKVSKQDDTPLPYPSGNITLHQTYYVTKETVIEETNTVDDGSTSSTWLTTFNILFPRHEPEEEMTVSSLILEIPPNGNVMFEINPFINVSRVSLKAQYNDLSAYASLESFRSPSNTFMQVRLMTQYPKAGENANFQIICTERRKEINYMILSKGSIMTSGKFNMELEIAKSFAIPMLHAYSPSARIVVQFVEADGEIVADALDFNVDTLFKNQVSIDFNRANAKPGEGVSLEVRAHPGSDVNLLAVDKSVLLAKSGNDITRTMVQDELCSYDPAFPFSTWMWQFPWPSPGMDVYSVYQDAGLNVLTDALLYRWEPPPSPSTVVPGTTFPQLLEFALSTRPVMSPPSALPKETEIRSQSKIRKLFPETWLYNRVKTGSDGTAVVNSTCPDSITTWIASAFAVNNETGLGIAPSTAELMVFLKFFINMQLPYSVIRGEHVIIQANIFNYHKEKLKVKVELKESKSFQQIVVNDKDPEGEPLLYKRMSVLKDIIVKPDDAVAVYFPILPTELGLVDVLIKASSPYARDVVLKKLLVEPEGDPQSYNVATLVELFDGKNFEKYIDVTYPEKVVEGSARIRISVTGDFMRPTIQGVENLLQMSYGCGEQNMINFAPNVFVSMYLKVINGFSSDMEVKAKDIMIKGYQRELIYQRWDGSFSAFGNSDSSGSTWLTAFVIKSFVQASPLIFIDPVLIARALDWLLRQSNQDGTFIEPGRVIHTEMQGGSSAGNINLAAYTVIALLEAKNFRFAASNRQQFSEVVNRTISFLEGSAVADLSQMGENKPFELALASYALTLAGSGRAADAMYQLYETAIFENGTMHWEQQTQAESDTWSWIRPNARNIESSAYVLLSCTLKRDIRKGQKILKWLISQRNPSGGFSSTQDTVVALQAMAEFASLTYSTNVNAHISMSGLKEKKNIFAHDFDVSVSNAEVLQTFNAPWDTDIILIHATGVGMALVEVAVFFNVELDIGQKLFFDLTARVTNEISLNEFTVEACFRWIGRGDESGMAVLEIGILSGFQAKKDTVTALVTIKRIEVNSRKVVIYFDKVESTLRCIEVKMQRGDLVAGSSPVPARIFDYYSPDKQSTVLYESERLKNSTICDICSGNCGCEN
ncbi:hypothetical protein CHS0354_016729 [Potamilus streckersoni]|uniref:CD109 antigen n=1 Tax=Potamilus streckersoni TaxID=2493646 RepID=A0AAE0TD49_9BIVA|nr:hypothetical protein CHS0354_016729 [Potamilus streckersoni]